MKKIKFKNKRIVCLTAYNKFSAELIDGYCDLVLVGDSLGMAYYGYSSTRAVKMDDIIRHAKSVRKGIKKSIMVVDMPYNTYKTKTLALKNAKKIIKETGADAVKLEGGQNIKNIVKHLVKNKINVMGHIGLMPQRIVNKKDYRVKGRKNNEKSKILKDLLAIQNLGVFAIVLEAVKVELANDVVKKSSVPIIGIGASKKCDGQILVLEDMLGFYNKVPKFVKKYMNFEKQARNAVKKYVNDVKKNIFPFKRNIYF